MTKRCILKTKAWKPLQSKMFKALQKENQIYSSIYAHNEHAF